MQFHWFRLVTQLSYFDGNKSTARWQFHSFSLVTRLSYSDGNHCTYCAWMQFHSFSLVTAELFWWKPLYLLRVDAISFIQSRDRVELYNSALSQDCMDEIVSTHSTFVPNTTTLLSRETERSTFRFPFKLNFHTMKCLTPLFLENSWWQFYWPWKKTSFVENYT